AHQIGGLVGHVDQYAATLGADEWGRQVRREVAPCGLYAVNGAREGVLHVVGRTVEALRHASGERVERLAGVEGARREGLADLGARHAHLRADDRRRVDASVAELAKVRRGDLRRRADLRHDPGELGDVLVAAAGRGNRVLDRVEVRDDLLRLDAEAKHLLLRL